MASRMALLILTFALIFGLACKKPVVQTWSFSKLMCEYAQQPVALQTPHPRFGWILDSFLKDHKQVAYRIQVATQPQHLEKSQPDLWDSGKVISSETLHNPYGGKALTSNQTCYWRVKVWDNQGQTLTSPVQRFHTAFLEPDLWQAQWIGKGPARDPLPEKGWFMTAQEQYDLPDTVQHDGRSLLLRKEVGVKSGIQSAWCYVSGLGFYELYLNGQRMGDHVLAPAKTPYHKQILYNVYDVRSVLQRGKNALGLHLGNGWFNPYKPWWQEYRMQWFGQKRAILQLVIEYKNGEQQIITTDESWKWSDGPLLYHCIYDGEVYDANKEPDGWATPDFDESDWQPVTVIDAPIETLESQTMPETRIVQELDVVQEYEPRPGVKIYDFGQNMAGWVKVRVKGEKGTRIQIRHAEDLHKDHTLDVTSNEDAKATAVYVLDGKGQETFQARFSYYGFQYAEITAEPDLPEILDVSACVVHTDNTPTSEFHSDHELLNKIHHATVWSQKSNMIHYPMDCPQRDERLGWFGDAQVTLEEAMFNFDMPLFFQNWLRGIQLNQNPDDGDIPIISPRPYIKDQGVEWSSTYIIATWIYYLYYGDKQILQTHYESMKDYIQFLESISTDYIVPKGWIGDWGSLVKGWKGGEPPFIPTAFFYYNSVLMSKMARVLDRPGDRAMFQNLSARIQNAFNREYYDPETANYYDGSQMANGFPLYLDLVPAAARDRVLENLVSNIREHETHLTTGVLGTKYVIDALTRHGRADVAFELATQTGFPSWGHMLEKYNTLCEFWTLRQSHNHVMMGSIDAWMIEHLAGIQLAETEPAFRLVELQPYFASDLDTVQCRIQTLRGDIESSWQRQDNGIVWDVHLPFNTLGRITLDMPAEQVFIDGVSISEHEQAERLNSKNAKSVFLLANGKYQIRLKSE
ncbi:Bacterial alpha-L-rhamnosidase [candidate division KSB1 bacterium]|nr:Bacterial alpha-L-rhamnosidase [candidate division KSB1 bacterium]